MGAFVKFDPHTFLRNREKAVLESDFVAGVAGVAGVHVDFRKLAEEQNPTLEADPVKSVAGVASVAGEDEDFSPPPENGKLQVYPRYNRYNCYKRGFKYLQFQRSGFYGPRAAMS